ncbi:MAG: hypothetical protein N3E46_04735 [Gemmataceae bacterium]|nr:hypothetical protein [Gemmataceae bacterium]
MSRVRLPFRHLAEEALAASCVSTIHSPARFGKPLRGERGRREGETEPEGETALNRAAGGKHGQGGRLLLTEAAGLLWGRYETVPLEQGLSVWETCGGLDRQ